MSAVASKSISGQKDAARVVEGTTLWKELIKDIEPFLKAVSENIAKQVDAFDPSIREYVEYALQSHGKQIRPALLALSAKTVSDELTQDHIKAAVIIEIVHLATLVHDDVIDGATIRRGKPTLAANWGNDITVLLGDCLFAHALKLAASFPTTDVCRAVSAATNTVCAGEIIQTQRQNNFNLTKSEYLKALSMKTGELFAVSCELGAFLSGASEKWQSALRQYGLELGTAYQIYDDCIDLFGNESKVGKSLGTDIAKGKLTLPILLVLERATVDERNEIANLIQNWKNTFLPTILERLAKYNALNNAREYISNYVNRAKEAINSTVNNQKPIKAQGVANLLALADFFLKQTEVLQSQK